uniref:Uncharacterized protein n=2 Tax=Heteroscytonema crispum TaxID=439476 RepID=A0A3G2KSQ9_9CYAN|nr:hypothetical protein [Heteroscytonema crispum UCFS10]AYN62322.1 hypothetical protein [Heteroscytonema crispum UCFS15]
MAIVVDDAKKRFLNDNAIFIPSSCRVAVASVMWKHFNSWLSRTYEFLMYWPNRNEKIAPNRYFIWNFSLNRFLTKLLEQENIRFVNYFFL